MWKCPCSDALTPKGGREGGESPEAEGAREGVFAKWEWTSFAVDRSGGNANELLVPLPPLCKIPLSLPAAQASEYMSIPSRS